MTCNINFTGKQNILPCLAHSSEKYDVKFALEGITNQETYVISELGESYVSNNVTEHQTSMENFHQVSLKVLTFYSVLSKILLKN